MNAEPEVIEQPAEEQPHCLQRQADMHEAMDDTAAWAQTHWGVVGGVAG